MNFVPSSVPTSSPRRLFAVLVAAIGFAFLSTSEIRAQASPTGTIRGQVSNGVTHSNLEGVRIQVVETGKIYYSSRDGSYEISSLAPGNYTVAFEYPGLDVQRLTSTVAAGSTAQQDVELTSGVYTMQQFAVAGDREGNAAAIVQQKRAVNVQNVVTSDAFGSIAKGNVGNFLKRIPGIAGTTDEVDTENIILRGMGANFTALDIDGTRAANGNPDGRNQSAAAIPTDMIEKAEVIKAPTPDVDADSLGGRINLVTKSAFDRKGREINLRAGSSYSFTYGKDVGVRNDDAFAPSLSANYSDVFSVGGGQNNLGIFASGNYERFLEVRGTTAWNFGTPLPSGKDYPQFDNVSVALHELVRGGGTIRLDYKASDRLVLQTSFGYGTYENNMFRTRNQMQAGTIRESLSTDPYFTVIDNARYRAIRETRDQTTNRQFGKLSAKFTAADELFFDADFSYDLANRTEDRTSYNPRSALKLSYVLDRREGFADARWPALRIFSLPGTTDVTTTTTPTSFLNVNPFRIDNFSNTDQRSAFWRRQFTRNPVIAGGFNVRKNLTWTWPIELKAGARYRSESVRTDRDEINGDMIGANQSGYMDDTWNLGGAIDRYPVGFVPDIDKIAAAGKFKFVGGPDVLNSWNYDPANFAINAGNTLGNSIVNDKKIWEDISAAYVQGKIELGKLQVLTGVRAEKTEIVTIVPLRDNSFAASDIRRYKGRNQTSKSYTDYFPSAHFRYELTRNLIVHASFSSTIGRPNFGDILSGADTDPVARTVTVANLDLKPQYSKNYDLSLEYYFEPVGVISVGVFQKNIRDFPVDADKQLISPAEAAEFGANVAPGDTTPWTLQEKINGGKARVRGIELNYSQSFTFLPGAFRGLGVFANFTYLQTEGTFSTKPPVTVKDLANFIPRTANAGISYAYNRYDARLQWNYTDAWLETVDLANPLQRNKWRGEKWQLDFSGKYKITRNIALFADFSNLTSNFGKKYRGVIDPTRREETNANNFQMTAGLQAKF